MSNTRLRLMCALTMLAGLSGCEALAPARSPPPTIITQTGSMLDSSIEMIAALSGSDRALQSDTFYEAEKNHTQSPTTVNTLRYGVALSVPGHPNTDPVKGKRLLEQLLANPERLSNSEQALATSIINIADQWLKTQAEMRRLAATVDDRTRAQSNSDRRLQTQTEELNKLRKALDAAQQKLDAIRDIEKSISERSTSPTGTRDSSNRDATTQTQTTPAGR